MGLILSFLAVNSKTYYDHNLKSISCIGEGECWHQGLMRHLPGGGWNGHEEDSPVNNIFSSILPTGAGINLLHQSSAWAERESAKAVIWEWWYNSDRFPALFSFSVLSMNLPIIVIGHFAGSPMVKNPPVNAGDTGSIPGRGRFHVPRSK